MMRKSQTFICILAFSVVTLLLGSSLAFASSDVLSSDQALTATPIPTPEPAEGSVVVFFRVPGAPLKSGPPPQPPSPPPPPEKPTEEAPKPPMKPSPVEGGGRGPSGKPHCNSAVNGLVTNHANGKGEPGIVVEIDASGWKERTTTDSNGHYYFHGLCQGRVIVNLALEEEGLPTNPNAVAELTGYNEVQIDLGFFPPAPTSFLSELVAVNETVMPLEPSATATVVPREGGVSEPPAARPTVVIQKATPEEAAFSTQRMPVTGYAVSSGYKGILLPAGIALGVLLLLGRRARHYLIG